MKRCIRSTKEKRRTHRAFLHQLQAMHAGRLPTHHRDRCGLSHALVSTGGVPGLGLGRTDTQPAQDALVQWGTLVWCETLLSTGLPRGQVPGPGRVDARQPPDMSLGGLSGESPGTQAYHSLREGGSRPPQSRLCRPGREPWLLATSLPVTTKLAKQVVRLYRLRMSIEEGFRDMKSHQFGLGLTYHRCASVERMQVLVFIATLALLVLWLVGTATTAQGAHYQFQANSVRHKRILSVLFVGLQMVQDTRIILTRAASLVSTPWLRYAEPWPA